MDNGASSYRRFLDGDDKGIAEIVGDYKDGLILYLNCYVNNIFIAEELTEDTFFRLITKRPRYSGKSTFKSWLYAIGRNVAVDFIKKYTKADGIISTKPALIKHAGEIGLTSVLRLFVIDSMAYENIQKHVKGARPDVIEVLPALMPKVVKRVCRISQIPVIAGGLVSDKEDVMSLLQAGVVSVSSTNKEIWFM